MKTSTLHAIWRLAWKDLLAWVNHPQVVAISLFSPLLLLTVSYLIFGGAGDAMPAALIVEGSGPHSTRLAEIIRTSHSRISNYFDIVTTDLAEAERLFEHESLGLIITIPSDFDARIDAGEEAHLGVRMNNKIADLTKNYRLRLDHVIRRFYEEEGGGQTGGVLERNLHAYEPRWMNWISVGLLVYVLMFAGMLNAGIAIANEWEAATLKLLILSPASRISLILGKILAGLIEALTCGAIFYLVTWALFGVRSAGSVGQILLVVIVTALAFVGLGTVLGVAIKRWMLLVAPSIVLAIGLWFLTGGFGHVALLPPVGQALARFLPPSYGLEALQQLMHTGATSRLGLDLGVLAGFAALTTAVGAWALARVQMQR